MCVAHYSGVSASLPAVLLLSHTWNWYIFYVHRKTAFCWKLKFMNRDLQVPELINSLEKFALLDDLVVSVPPAKSLLQWLRKHLSCFLNECHLVLWLFAQTGLEWIAGKAGKIIFCFFQKFISYLKSSVVQLMAVSINLWASICNVICYFSSIIAKSF